MIREEAKKIAIGIKNKIECNTADIDGWAEFWGFTREEYEEFLDRAIKVTEQEPKTGHWVDNMDLGYHVSIPSAYKGMTNGEVIKMLYPQGEIVKGLYGISGNPLICVNLNISTECSEMVFTEDWWNSPYEPQESENKE